MLEVEGDREVARRDLRRADQVQAHDTTSGNGRAEPRIGPGLPTIVHVACIVGLPIRPHQVRAQMERPGFSVGADTPILQCGNLAHSTRMHHPLRIPIEEGQVQRLVNYQREISNSRRAIGNEQIYV